MSNLEEESKRLRKTLGKVQNLAGSAKGRARRQGWDSLIPLKSIEDLALRALGKRSNGSTKKVSWRCLTEGLDANLVI